MGKFVKFDSDKCIGCGLCVDDCLSKIIRVENGLATIGNFQDCIKCGHCGAICPEDAVIYENILKEEIIECDEELRDIDFHRLNAFIKMKRSTRQYLDKSIDNKIIKSILEIGRVSPTGGNRQPLKFVVVSSQENMEKLKVMAMKSLCDLSEKVTGRYKEIFANILINYQEDNYDRLFYNAPVLVVIYGDPNESGSIFVDAGIAVGQMSLIGNSLGLGSCFIGFLNTAAQNDNNINEFLGIPEGNKMIANIIFGYPNVEYFRTVPRNMIDVTYL